MGETESISFLGMNFLLIAGVGLLIFTYFVLLIRKRWKENFLHKDTKKSHDSAP
jgi:hypothetical protein